MHVQLAREHIAKARLPPLRIVSASVNLHEQLANLEMFRQQIESPLDDRLRF
jgi:hypothetical protein